MSRMPGITLPASLTAIVASQRARAEAFRAEHGLEAKRWWQVKNQTADSAEVWLYDEVGGWFGSTAEDFIDELSGITAPNILLRVNSPGGSVFEGIAIANALRSHPANVTVQVDSLAASIASVIAMAGDHVRMMPGAMIMVHDASGLCMGDASDMTAMAEVLDTISDNIASAYAARAGGSEADWRGVMRNETWYRGQAAVDAGLADEYVDAGKHRGKPEPDGDEPEPSMRKAFNPTAYGYRGPQQPAPDTPATEPEPQPEAAPTLVLNIEGLLDETTVAKLRAAVADRSTETERAEPGTVAADSAVPEILNTACPVHHTATEDRPWDAAPNLKRLPSPMTVATAKKMFAWYDGEQVADGEIAKAACSLPHHEVSADGTPGAANLAGVRNALSRLPQSDIPASEHDAVRRHLQAHLDDAKTASDHTPEPTAGERWQQAFEALIPEPTDPWTAAYSALFETASPSSAATEA